MTWRRRAAPVLLLVGGLGVYQMIGTTLPHDQDVSVDLGDLAPGVTSVQIAWTQPGSPDDSAVSTRWNFDAGSAPRRVKARARLPNGRWIADVDLARGDAGASHWSRQVDLTGDPMTLPVGEVAQ